MKKEHFEFLLKDLYTAYNPSYLRYIPDLVERYTGLEYAAVDMILVKYNHKDLPYYEEEKNKDSYKLSLISEYGKGNRVLENYKPQVNITKLEEKKENVEEKIQEIKDNINTELSGKLKSADETLKAQGEQFEKIYAQKIQELDEIIKQKSTQKASHFEDIEIRILSNYTESELELPNKDILCSLGKGTKLVAFDKDKKVVGLEIKEIIYDCISGKNGKPIIEITIDKA